MSLWGPTFLAALTIAPSMQSDGLAEGSNRSENLDLCIGRLYAEFPPLPTEPVREKIPIANEFSATPLAYNLHNIGEETRVTAAYLIGSIDVMLNVANSRKCEKPKRRETQHMIERFIETDQSDFEGNVLTQCAKLALRYSSSLKGGVELLQPQDFNVFLQARWGSDESELYQRKADETIRHFDHSFFGL